MRIGLFFAGGDTKAKRKASLVLGNEYWDRFSIVRGVYFCLPVGEPLILGIKSQCILRARFHRFMCRPYHCPKDTVGVFPDGVELWTDHA